MPSPSIAITHAVTVESATDASPEHTASTCRVWLRVSDP